LILKGLVMNPPTTTPDSITKFSQRSLASGDQPISVLMARALAQPDLISLAAGFVDQSSLPVEIVREACERLLSRPEQGRAALQYGTTAGHRGLREAICQNLATADRISGEGLAARCIVTAGSNQLLHLVAEAILDEGDVVLCAAPTYLVFMGTLAGVHAVSWSVRTDHQGMVPEAVEEALSEFEARGELERVKAIYSVTYYDNPQGISTTAARRAEMVEIAKRWSKHHKIYVIDDTAYRELRYEGQDEPSLLSYDETGSHVIETGTFSKSFSPGIRVGWGVIPSELFTVLEQLKGNIDFGSPNFSQSLMADILESGAHAQQVETLRAVYSEKRDAMLTAMEPAFAGVEGVHWVHPKGGLYVWLTLPEHLSTGPQGRLFDEAIRRGVLYVPGQYCFPEQGVAGLPNTIRLSFGVQSPERIQEGIVALAEAVKAVI
jgi:2-aminoadipate transaminase